MALNPSSMLHPSNTRAVSDFHTRPNSSPPPPSDLPPIFRLPRELRDIIYDYYIRCDGGYIFDAETRKFMQRNGEPVCYALAFTCKQAASELAGLPFGLNSLTFSSTSSTSTHEKAGLQHHVALKLRSSKQALLELLPTELFTRPMGQAAAKRHPEFAGLISVWAQGRAPYTFGDFKESFGEARSIWNDFVDHVLELISEHPDYAETIKALPSSLASTTASFPARSKSLACVRLTGCRDLLRLKDAHLQPWLILDHAELQRLSDMLPSFLEIESPRENTGYDYSAAAVALQFLASCTKTIRSSVRKIVLEENGVSIAQPECHGRGFIPICQENRSLQVERRVSLWKTVFEVCPGRREGYIRAAESNAENNFQGDRLLAPTITKSLGKWVTETMALHLLGMPEGSHTLVLDGDPIPEHTAEVFRTVQRDAAWQAALDICLSRHVFEFDPSWTSRRCNSAFIFRGLPELIRTLSTGSAPVKCNFHLHSGFDLDSSVQTLLEKSEQPYRWRFTEDWSARWNKHNPYEFQTEAPLPPWHILRWRHVLPNIPPRYGRQQRIEEYRFIKRIRAIRPRMYGHIRLPRVNDPMLE